MRLNFPDGVSELRFSGFLPMLAGLLFGPIGAIGCALGNFLSDMTTTLSPSDLFGSFGVFLCKQFYENFPRSLDEAATIDGANKWRLYFSIYVPNSRVILATLALLKGVAVWNDYLWPLVMTNSEASRTVQLGLTMFRNETVIDWGPLMAAATLVSVPMVLLFLCTQKYFVQGIVSTGLK